MVYVSVCKRRRVYVRVRERGRVYVRVCERGRVYARVCERGRVYVRGERVRECIRGRGMCVYEGDDAMVKE